MKTIVTNIRNCKECPHVSHSGAFTPGGARPLCGAMTGRRYKYGRKELPSIISYDQKTGKKLETWSFEIPNWCPL